MFKWYVYLHELHYFMLNSTQTTESSSYHPPTFPFPVIRKYFLNNESYLRNVSAYTPLNNECMCLRVSEHRKNIAFVAETSGVLCIPELQGLPPRYLESGHIDTGFLGFPHFSTKIWDIPEPPTWQCVLLVQPSRSEFIRNANLR